MKQENLFDSGSDEKVDGPVECLGITFENDGYRRSHFTELLREKLKDPEFRAIEGFPIGTDEAILELSDPPYYTACPNPWLNEFIEFWESHKERKESDYHREPFAADVSEGKNDPIYNAHSYHTKVPHKAVMRYILHYTNPGDIVFDGFCGTGMTGIAAQLCNDEKLIESLGYKIKGQSIFEQGEKVSKVGARRCLLNDLSPAATHIAYNYNTPTNQTSFSQIANLEITKVEKSLEWMYETKHSNDGNKNIHPVKGRIIHVIWSEVFSCPSCSSNIVFWEQAYDNEMKMLDEIPCNSCGKANKKKDLEKNIIQEYDEFLNEGQLRLKLVPVQIRYEWEGKRYSKKPDKYDFEVLEKIKNYRIDKYVPIIRNILGKETRRNDPIGITHSHHFFIRRTLIILSELSHYLRLTDPKYLWLITAILEGSSLLNRERPNGLPSKLSGTLYISSMIREVNVFAFITRKVARYQGNGNYGNAAISTSSTTKLNINDETIDYAFIDPPFGANLNYSELNFIWESWLRVMTNNKEEAIENSAQGKKLIDYGNLMLRAFEEIYRILKPGRWMTVEFSNTKASVWNSIQSSISQAGFIVANVSALDKKQMSFKAITTSTAVKQDLVISAYKPSKQIENIIANKSEDKLGVWEFIKSHLDYLSPVKVEDNMIKISPERDPRVLYDKVVSYYIRHNLQVPISSAEFQVGLANNFIERDGMYFLPEQVSKYDKVKASLKNIMQLSIFVDDEASAIEWLRQHLKEKPKTYSEIHPVFISELSSWKKNELQLELLTLLEQNFIKYEGEEEVPSQIHSYLSTNFKDMRGLSKADPALVIKAKDRWYVPDVNKTVDIEKIRLKSLLREFESYKVENKKIKQPRAEALRAGFSKCWEDNDLQTILDISAKIPIAILQEDEKISMFHDNALTLTDSADEW